MSSERSLSSQPAEASSRSASPRPSAAAMGEPGSGGAHPLLQPHLPSRNADPRASMPNRAPSPTPPPAQASQGAVNMAAATALATPSAYGALNYAPRQRTRPPHLHTQSSYGAPSYSSSYGSHGLAPSISSPSLAPPEMRPRLSPKLASDMALSEAQEAGHPAAPSAEARLALQKLKAEVQQMGLTPASLGWALLEKIQGAGDGEWAALAELVGEGEATLLLPRSTLASPNDLTLSLAYDHILLGASRPSAGGDVTSVVTLSGLRGSLSSTSTVGTSSSSASGTRLDVSSFVPRADYAFVSELRNVGRRGVFLEALGPHPSQSAPTPSYPSFELASYEAALLIPPAPPPRPAPAIPARTRGGSLRGNEADQARKAGNRASTSFASLFGGSGRAQQQQQRAAEDFSGSELKTVGPGTGAGLSPPEAGTPGRPRAGSSSSLASFSSHTSGPQSAAEPPAEPQQGSKERSVAVWIVDRELRHRNIVRQLDYGMRERLKAVLGREAGLSSSIVEVVCSFASMFLPPSAMNAQSPNERSPLQAAFAPYLSSPDELSDSFQDLFASLRGQIESAGAQADAAHAAARDDASKLRKQDEVDALLERIEEALCAEVQDRIFSPISSRDSKHDEALSSRIAALNVLGLNLDHLGLLIPNEATDPEQKVALGLQELVARCGATLQQLHAPTCRSPRDKLAVLVAVHKQVVDGLALLPRIELKDQDGNDEPKVPPPESDAAADAAPAKPSTSSADLILPILIFAIVRSNPAQLPSNLLFIQRFRAESLVRGEASYCLVNVQAAVAFLENVKPKEIGLSGGEQALGLDASVESLRSHDSHGRSSASEMEAAQALSRPEGSFSMPTRIRGRVAQEIGELAGMSNRVITGVMGTSLYAFGRMMGASAAAGYETFERGRADGPKTLEEIKGLLSGGSKLMAPRNAAEAEEQALRASRVREREAMEGRGALKVPGGGRPRPAHTETDYGNEDEQVYDRPLPESLPKPSLSDRLASIPMLGRLTVGTPPAAFAQLSSSPTPNTTLGRELPGPPPPAKPARGRTHSGNSVQSGMPPPGVLGQFPAASSPIATSFASGDHIPASLQSPYPPLSYPPTPQRPLHIVLASTGSVASIKVPLIVEELMQYANVRVQIVATASSLHFYTRESIAAIEAATGDTEGKTYTVEDLAAENKAAVRGTSSEGLVKPRAHLWTDIDEWKDWKQVGDPILHIELRRWADIVIVAPCSANTLAKLTAGICDTLLTSFLRALSPSTPTLLFPAMNTLMFMHPLTARQIAFAQDTLGYEVIGPISKLLACGDLGQGAMEEWTDIVELVVRRYSLAAQQPAQPNVEGMVTLPTVV